MEGLAFIFHTDSPVFSVEVDKTAVPFPFMLQQMQISERFYKLFILLLFGNYDRCAATCLNGLYQFHVTYVSGALLPCMKNH